MIQGVQTTYTLRYPPNSAYRSFRRTIFAFATFSILIEPVTTMHLSTFLLLAAMCCCFACHAWAEEELRTQPGDLNSAIQTENTDDGVHIREKRTLFLKKKLFGAGLLGFGLGLAKGYKAGHYTAPEVHHVYLSPPPPAVKYVEYVEKPVFVERIIERPEPIFKASQRDSYPYGSW